MRNRVWWFASLPLLAVGCASPGDVEASYSRELGTAQEKLTQAQRGVDAVRHNYEVGLASAREWDVHTLGIPASGWVAILIVVAVLLFVLLAWGVYLLKQSSVARMQLRNAREKRAHELRLAEEKTLQRKLEAQKAEYDSVQRYVPPPLSSEVKR